MVDQINCIDTSLIFFLFLSFFFFFCSERGGGRWVRKGRYKICLFSSYRTSTMITASKAIFSTLLRLIHETYHSIA